MSRDDGRELDLQTKGRSICQWTIATDQVPFAIRQCLDVICELAYLPKAVYKSNELVSWVAG